MKYATGGNISPMNDYYDQELDRLHTKLAAIYRLGKLTPQEELEAKGLWARIERLKTTQTAVTVREAKRRAELLKEQQV